MNKDSFNPSSLCDFPTPSLLETFCVLPAWKYLTTFVPKSETQTQPSSCVHYVCVKSPHPVAWWWNSFTSKSVKTKAGIKVREEPQREKHLICATVLLRWLVSPQCLRFWSVVPHDTCRSKQTVCHVAFHVASSHRRAVWRCKCKKYMLRKQQKTQMK